MFFNHNVTSSFKMISDVRGQEVKTSSLSQLLFARNEVFSNFIPKLFTHIDISESNYSEKKQILK